MHSGFCAIVESDLLKHGPLMITTMKALELKNLVFTGHSLAGGAAQVANLVVSGWMIGEINEYRCEYYARHAHARLAHMQEGTGVEGHATFPFDAIKSNVSAFKREPP